jgi:hypothetical protein
LSTVSVVDLGVDGLDIETIDTQTVDLWLRSVSQR